MAWIKTGLARFQLDGRFLLLWLGDSISLLSTSLIEFTISIWIYQHSGSVTAFAGAIIAATWAPIIFLPLAGGLADRVDKKYLVIGSDIALALMMLGLAILFWTGRLQLQLLYVFNCLAAVITRGREPAYKALLSTILAKDDLVQANGLLALGRSLSTMLSPPLAGLLLGCFGLGSVFTVALITFTGGVLLVLKVLFKLPLAAHSPGDYKEKLSRSVLGNLSASIAYFKIEPLMSVLLIYVIIQSSLIALSTFMIVPLVMATHTSAQLALIYTCGAFGGLSGAASLVAVRKPSRLLVTIACADLVLSLCLFGFGATASISSYCFLAFLTVGAGGISGGCLDALWMRKTPMQYRASIFALVSMLTLASMAGLLFAGGFLVDHVLEPGFATGGRFAGSLGTWLGTGKGKGIAFLFIASGVLGALLCMISLAVPKIRRIDRLVADHDHEMPTIPIALAAGPSH